MKSLEARAWFALAAFAVAMGLLIFIAAGTARYWPAWVYLSIFFGGAVLMTVFLLRSDPALVERRMKGGPFAEKRPTQKVITFGASIAFIALFVVPALDYRFRWSTVPLYGIVLGDVLVLIGLFSIFLVYRENTFTSAIIEVAPDQRVVSTGPYAFVRHPLYASALLYLAGTPLALASYWGLAPLAVMLPLLVWRLLDEERFLAQNLQGYADYQKSVRHRLVPRIW